MWNLYGKQYDLTKYIELHPGGKDILICAKDEQDITCLFETYHAFSDISKIKKILDKYEVTNTSNEVTNKSDVVCDKNIKYEQYDFTNYHKLLNKIKIAYPDRSSIKATSSWFLFVCLTFIMYCMIFYTAMFSNYNIIIKSICGLLAGILYISIGFTVMHDASHYAVCTNTHVNRILSKLWNGFILWNPKMWFYHHVYNHHSFTGVENRDPDLYHLRPFIRKLTSDTKVLDITSKIQDKIVMPILFIFPGQTIGQGISYLIAAFRKRLFKIKIPNISYYDKIDTSLILLNIYCLYNGLIWPTINYIIALNITYSINIVLDHDMFETAIDNHYTGNDWLKLQICNSGNFLNNNMFWSCFFGGINYQIEHHLFPNMSNVHYPIIAPIVKQHCLENNIPYVCNNSLYDAYTSYLKTLKYTRKV